MSSGYVHNIPITPAPATDEDRDAARRMVARNVQDAAERTQVEAMLGLSA
ncbi:hypothetical protein [Microbacterium sp. 69-10]|nr:hypothetical protein [Microbacterium sp. 69-10]